MLYVYCGQTGVKVYRNFRFLKEKARKSVRKSYKKSIVKPSYEPTIL